MKIYITTARVYVVDIGDDPGQNDRARRMDMEKPDEFLAECTEMIKGSVPTKEYTDSAIIMEKACSLN